MKKFLKILSFILVSLVASIAIDRGIGLLHGQHEPVGLLFPPHSKAFYKTGEFSYEADINGLGFRGREFNVAKGANYRVVAIGDSFTYGWGVNLEQSWPKALERNLLGHGLPVEIANLAIREQVPETTPRPRKKPFLFSSLSPIEYETWREYGFSLDKAMLTSDSPDQAIKLACDESGLPFFSVTARFRKKKNRDAHFFYKLDGHFDPSGHQFYADQLTPIMGQFVKARMAGSL